MVTSALFMTLRNMPMMAETGMRMIFFNGVTVFAFLIPVALVSAELATGWPHNGVYHWVREAFGVRCGWLAVWLQWIQSIFGITSILAYAAATFFFVINPDLATNKYAIVLVILGVYWGATYANLHGTKLSGMISSICVISGVFVPAIVLIVLALIYACGDHVTHLELSFDAKNLLPSIHRARDLTLFLSFIFGFVGVEVSASHAREVRDPHRSYPIAIFSAAIIGFILTLLGGMAVAVVVPAKSLNLVSGAVQTFAALFETYRLSWLIPVAGFLISFGAAGQVSTWIIGPIKGIFAAGRAGNLPPILQKSNDKGVPRNLLILQASLISFIAVLLLVIPNINVGFLVLTTVAVFLYALMYIIMFVAAIRLRYTHPDTPRPYRVPGGKAGMWAVGGVGLVTAFACLSIGFIPPAGLGIATWLYEGMLILCAVVLVAFPLTLYRFRRPEWLR
jgi:amino acid transporter